MATNRSRKKTTASAKKAARPTKAQVAFAEHQERINAAKTAAATAPQASSFPQGGVAMPAMPTWGFPPSLAALPPQFAADVPQGAAQAADSLGERLGTTLRLGVEVLNAGLGTGLRLLDGLTGMTSELGDVVWPRSGPGACGCGYCCDPCAAPCGGYDCCCLLGCGCQSCCEPSVGTCC